MSAPTRSGPAFAFTTLLVCALFARFFITPSRPQAVVDVAHPSFVIGKPSAGPPEKSAPDGRTDAPVDFLGNAVTPAVATYRLDAAGSLYETHAPNVEIPRLGSPQG